MQLRVNSVTPPRTCSHFTVVNPARIGFYLNYRVKIHLEAVTSIFLPNSKAEKHKKLSITAQYNKDSPPEIKNGAMDQFGKLDRFF